MNRKNGKLRVSFNTIGCKLNFTETSTISREIEDRGFIKVGPEEKADIYVINTCSVTRQAELNFEKLVKHIKSGNPLSKIVAVGCYAELNPDRISACEHVDMVLGNIQKFELYNYLENLELYENKLVLNSSFKDKKEFRPAFSTRERTRSFVKIQDGCDYFCSYCTIPLARGKSRSDTIANIVKTTREILKTGVKEIILTGVNIGDYKGMNGETLLDLLFELEDIPKLERLRLSSIEPDLLTDDIIEFATTSRILLPHFHIPLQSGSDKVLKLMGRKYTTGDFANLMSKIKTHMPDAGIGVDIIVGFPGESDSDFMETMQFLGSMDISYIHVFPFSERPNTKAMGMSGKVGTELKKQRRISVKELSDLKRMTFYRQNLGKIHNVLFERKSRDGNILGLTGNYIKVKTTHQASLQNKIAQVKLIDIDTSGLVKGELVSNPF